MLIQCFEELHDGANIKFKIQFLNAKELNIVKRKGFLNTFRLVGRISTNNMHLINVRNEVVKYATAEQSKCFSLNLLFK